MADANDVMNMFTFNDKEVLIIFDSNNEPWFKAKDVADILEYANTNQAIQLNIDNEDKCLGNDFRGLCHRPLTNNEKNTIYINESGLYSLILKSRKEEAKVFQKWVTKEVLPSIRKYGEYKLRKENHLLRSIISSQDELISNQKTINSELKIQNNLLKPLVVPPTANSNLLNVFLVIKTNDPEYFDYYVIRCQRINHNTRLNKIKRRHPNLDIVYRLMFNLNSINLYNRMRESLNIYSYRNYFNYLGESLIKDINSLINVLSNSL